MQLSDREQHILSVILESYIENGQPVSSRFVSKHEGIDLSPASVRNVMADLTDKGYLEQPHTSAGRIPTAASFRIYLDRLLRLSPLDEQAKKRLMVRLDESGMDIPDLLRRAGKVLSEVSSQVSMVLAPLQGQVRWKRIEFALIKPDLVMVILVLQGGIVQKRLVELDTPVTSDDLSRYANYLNDLFEDRTVSQVRAHILAEVGGARKKLSNYFRQALNLVQQTVDMTDERELFVDGTLNILSQPDFSDLPRIRELMQALEDRTRLLAFLDRIVESDSLTVTLGQESTLTALSDCGLITSPYTVKGRTLGVIGLIGPLRMNYANLLPVVDCTAKIITQILQKRF